MTQQFGTPENGYALNIEQIREYLPHRQPFLLVDRVLRITPKGDLSSLDGTEDKVGTEVVALKNMSYSDPIFAGHFPQFSIFPGVMTIEAMAQTAGFAAYPFAIQNIDAFKRGFQLILVGVDEARFRKPIVPGDTVIFEATLSRVRKTLWSFDCRARVQDAIVAQAKILANLSQNPI